MPYVLKELKLLTAVTTFLSPSVHKSVMWVLCTAKEQDKWFHKIFSLPQNPLEDLKAYCQFIRIQNRYHLPSHSFFFLSFQVIGLYHGEMFFCFLVIAPGKGTSWCTSMQRLLLIYFWVWKCNHVASPSWPWTSG